jgi:ligand-binding sensor domain-containing protein
MKSRIRFAIGAIVSLTLVALIFGLSIKRVSAVKPEPQKTDLVAASVDSQPAPVTPAPDDDLLANIGDQPETFKTNYSEVVDSLTLDQLDFDDVRDVQIAGNRLLLATAGGLVEYSPADSSFAIYSFPQGVEDYDCRAVLRDHDITLLGTSGGVYCIDQQGEVARIWDEIKDTVTTIDSFDDRFFVGTQNSGLYKINDDVPENILPDKTILAFSDDQYGLWAATRQDGLLFADGEGWHKRFLIADTTAFAEATCLESVFGRLWVGTPAGVYVYDGGTWELLHVGDEEVGGNITSIARGRGFIYFGTATSGVYSYYAFDGSLMPLPWSEKLDVTSIDFSAGRYLVGTDNGAVFKTPRRELHIHDLFNQKGDLASAF